MVENKIQALLNTPIPSNTRKVNDDGSLGNRVPQGANLDFIACYLYANGPSRGVDILNALKTHNRIPCDKDTQGQYTEYLYVCKGSHQYARCKRHAHYDNDYQPKSPLWEQHTLGGTWTLTVLGLKRVHDFLAR